MFKVDYSDQQESKASHQSKQSPGGVCLPGPYVSHHDVYSTHPMFVILKLRRFIDILSNIPNGHTNKLTNIKPVTKALSMGTVLDQFS